MAKQGEATLLLKIKTLGEEAISKIEDSLESLKKTGLAAFAAITGAIYFSIKAYQEQEEATNALTQAMVNNGVYSRQLKQEYLDQATALMKITKYGDEQITNAQAAIIQQVGQIKVTENLTKAVLDFATAQKIDVVSAGELVGKSIGTATNALGRYGIEITAGASKAQKMQEAVDGLTKKFGGQAQAATDGYGIFVQMKNALGELGEMLGEKLQPMIIFFSKLLMDLMSNTSDINEVMDVFVNVLKFLAVQGLDAFGVIQQLGAAIGIGLATAVEAASQALEGNFSQAMETVSTGFQSIQDETMRIEQQTSQRIRNLLDSDNDAREAANKKDEENLQKSLENKAALRLQKSAEQKAQELEAAETRIAQQNIDMELEKASIENQNMAKIDAQIKTQELLLAHAKTHNAKMAAENEIYRLNELKKQAIADEMRKANQADTFAKIASMSQSNNEALAVIGKGAALTQIAIDTPVAVSKALAAFPPPFNFIAAGLVAAAEAEQAAKVAGIPLAEGGIVKARPGGIQATIGEGGRDEAVIPLEDGQIPGSKGGGNTYVLQGPIFLGDENSASQFIEKVDQGLLKLRQNGGSVAFERL